MDQLINIDSIFKKRLFRIPDYQRGYAWQTAQLKDFWEDINSLEDGKNHYTGVLSLEAVPESKWKEWEDDKWLSDNKTYKFYYVVDGQQRLTTCVILIQTILEAALEISRNGKSNYEDIELCDTKISDIKRDYIFTQRSGSIVRSYIFGYEKDNPSYEFLKTKIFNETSTSNKYEETLYTQNLENAKVFFKENLLAFPEKDRLSKLESIYKKVTQQLCFNEFVIQNDIDVYMAFETMNNRGKQLSALELLKNRLIYLSTLYKVDNAEKLELRKCINNSWMEIYFNLGRSKSNKLSDDDFLKDHWIMYFKYSRKRGDDFKHFLLDEFFNAKRVLEKIPVTVAVVEPTEVRDETSEEQNEIEEEQSGLLEPTLKAQLTIEDISKYAESIQNSSRWWYYTFNPEECKQFTREEKKWLDCLNRIGIAFFRPLVMSSFINPDITSEQRVKLFKSIERYIFIAFRLSQARSNFGSSEFYRASKDLYTGEKNIDAIINDLNEKLERDFFNDGKFVATYFIDFISKKFKNNDGYYGWRYTRYFLYEYEQELYGKSKNPTSKIMWEKFVNTKDTVTIEHILPQTPVEKCWQESFKHYSQTKLKALTNSLGNLLALSQPKNSSLQNKCFAEKRADKNAAKGYFNGSLSENKVAEENDEWKPGSIKKRGLELLQFMENRWNITLGDETVKLELLNLEFLGDEKH